MTLNRVTGRARILRVAITQLGKGYSEQSPQGSDGDGHYWSPGEPWPDLFDCSGLVYTCCRAAGIVISNGNADEQFRQHIGGVVPAGDPLVPGDVGSFMGSDNTPGYAGHTGIVESYDAASGVGTMVNAADTQLGVIRSEFVRSQVSNLNGLGVIGFYRPANALPPPPEPDIVPPTPAELAARRLTGLPTPADAQLALDNGWPLFVWSGGRFVPQPAPKGDPHTITEYANVAYRRPRFG